MDPGFRRNYQLHMLMKKRTCITDNELYEMMRSKNVYRAQNEIRRELDRRLQAINQDQKVKIASFMLQRATFVKMVTAREKGLRHLLDVKRELGDTFFHDEILDDTEEDELDIPLQPEPPTEVHNDDVTHNTNVNKGKDQRDAQQPIVQSVNREWMDRINKGEHPTTRGSDGIEIHVADFDHNRKERSLKERIQKELDEDPEQESTSHNAMETKTLCTSQKHCKNNQPKIARPEDLTNLLPEIQDGKDKQPKKNCQRHSDNHSSYEGLGLFHTNHSNNSSQNAQAATHSLHVLKAPERERTVSMLFVEDCNLDDDRLDLISPFDVEAFIKQNRRKRGHSIIIASNDLHQDDDNEQDKNPDSKDKKKTKKIHSKKRHPATWGVKDPDGNNARERSKQWYERFLINRSMKKHLIKPSQSTGGTSSPQRSENLFVYPKGQKVETWNTPGSSDSQISANLYDLRIQRLRQHCQELSDRVADFVAS